MNEINDIVHEIEMNKNRKLYDENADLFDIVGQYIISKKLMIYGGLTINLLLPKKHRFYKDYTLNDFDCYSKNALEDSLDLANILKLQGYEYIKVRKAKHASTYRVYANNIQIIDISNIDKELYDKLLAKSLQEHHKLKYYKSDYNIIPMTMIKKNLYYELSRPEQSGFRWDKIYKRLAVFSDIYKNKTVKNKLKLIQMNKEQKILKNMLLKHIKENKYPIIEEYGMNLHMNKKYICSSINNVSFLLVILSNDYDKTINEIYKLIYDKIDKNKYEIIVKEFQNNYDIINSRYSIGILNKKNNTLFRLISILKNENDCFSVQKKNGFTVGSIDTILYFLYSMNLLNDLYINKNEINIYTSIYINQCEKYIADFLTSPKSRLMTKCYGNVKNDIINLNLWKQRMTIKHL